MEELILNLTTIGSLRPDDKLSVYYGRFHVVSPCFLRSVRRYISGQNRRDIIAYISTTVNYGLLCGNSILSCARQSEDEYDLDLLSNEDKDSISKLFNGFVLCLNGLEELTKSYGEDRTSISQIDVIRSEIIVFVELCRDIGISRFFRNKLHYVNSI
uniref:Uncharacterized protein n=1 Tax=viral metagenome TaxID=1070528 RepID=A0A6C0AVK7_9ZZZZ|tara:strand:- start:8248 stop:8718 length:471 start_codon:yes stop_codon:yes gene_type:complete